MAIYHQFLAAVLLLLFAVGSSSFDPSAVAVEGSVHEMLTQYGFPPGIIPDSVERYSVAENGDFEVELKSPCYVKFSDLVHYDRRIKGKISFGVISALSGIEVKKVFFWVPITGIVSHPDGRTLEFEVGFLVDTLPVDLFAQIPVCKSKAGCRGAAMLTTDAVLIPRPLPFTKLSFKSRHSSHGQDHRLRRSSTHSTDINTVGNNAKELDQYIINNHNKKSDNTAFEEIAELVINEEVEAKQFAHL